MTDLLQSHDNTLTDEELLLMDEQKKWFLEIECTPGEDYVKIIEMKTKNLEYYIKIVDKVLAWLKKIYYNFERSSTVVKIVLNNITCYKEIICERRSQ